jgi:hypothetical protein
LKRFRIDPQPLRRIGNAPSTYYLCNVIPLNNAGCTVCLNSGKIERVFHLSNKQSKKENKQFESQQIFDEWWGLTLLGDNNT